MSTTRVVLVDDHPLVLQGFKVSLESIDGIEVVGTSDNSEEGYKKIIEEKPEVALLDIMLPGESGIEMLRKLKDEGSETRVIFITASDSDLYLVESLRYGASGYLSKDASKALIEAAVRGAMQDGVTLSGSLTAKAFGAISNAADGLKRKKKGAHKLVELSTKEIDVLRLLATGKSNVSISKELSTTQESVKEAVLSLRKKFGTRDRISTALQGMRLGLVE